MIQTQTKRKRILLLTSLILSLTIGTVIVYYIYYVYYPENREYDIELKAGFYDNEPKVFEDDEGNAKGIFPELLDYIASQENWKIEWVKGSWDECLDNLEAGDIDIMVDVAYTENRSKLYDFNSVEVLNNWGIIYESDGSSIESIEDLEDKEVAVMAGSTHTNAIKDLTTKWNINCTYIEVESYDEVFEKINDDDADAGAVNRLFGLEKEKDYNVERTSIVFNPSMLFFAFPKGAKLNDDLIPKIDEQLNILIEDTSSIYYQLLDKYIYGQETGTIPEWVFPVLIIAFGLVAIFGFSSVALRRMGKKLSNANDRLKSLDELKSMFIASMSHELRTPLTSIIGFTNMLLKGWVGEINEEQGKQLNIILKSANHLLDLISDVIDVSKIETERLELQIVNFDLNDLMNDLKETFMVLAEKKQLNLKFQNIQSVNLITDKRRMKQILVNLIGNAIKFTDKGEVNVNVEDARESIKISFKDTGIGIKKEDLEKLFKPFSRVVSPNQFKEGTGLGLHLSQKLANILEGNIEVSSEYGIGTTFSLTIKKNIGGIQK